MSSNKQSQKGVKPESQKDGKASQNEKVKSTISRAEAIQQREQLRQMIINKFINDLAKGNKKKQQIIQQEVDKFFKAEKITEQSLKDLKVKVQAAVSGKSQQPALVNTAGEPKNASQEKPANKSQAPEKESKSAQIANQLVENQTSKQQQQKPQQQEAPEEGKKQAKVEQNDDLLSETSSKAPRSVYYLEGDEEDEWATLVKFDTELFKKERELEKQREKEFKKKIKNELDKQLQERDVRKVSDKNEEQDYVKLQSVQICSYDDREKQKEEEKKHKIMLEKQQRDKQVHDENMRRKMDRKREKELDEMLVKRLVEEKQQEEEDFKQRKLNEKGRLQEMMKENEDYRAKQEKEQMQEKESDIRLQQEAIRLSQEMEEQREQEKKNREDKIKRIMSQFADTVVKDQKKVIDEEDQKMLNHQKMVQFKAEEEDARKRQQLLEQKKEMREFLNKQIEEKNQRVQKEEDINKQQADIWAKDRENYLEHEKQKKDYINFVNKKHQEVLVKQIEDKTSKKKHKMNAEELLQNKSRLKEIAEKDPEIALNIKKAQLNEPTNSKKN
eukprot:TRINITY_DN4527_c0_g1_i4.p1 TRINITY_DN4527_c0_g1~~TRINITY_DN4527_c0_g1_i4.p1  ORF type:complete len:557 (+),score=167.16 TRINITY_DN4527_c0_g1_i4:224-1894(+)